MLALVLNPVSGESVAADWPPRDGLRVVFLGDSITQNGLYVRYVDAYLLSRFPDRQVEVIGLGLSSETCRGRRSRVTRTPGPTSTPGSPGRWS